MKPSKLGLNTMTVTELARLGGLTKSISRAKASRENGKLGGRPRTNKYAIKRLQTNKRTLQKYFKGTKGAQA